MNRQSFPSLLFLLIAFAVGCGDPAAPLAPFQVALAKGGQSAAQRADFTITDAGLSLVSDGKGGP